MARKQRIPTSTKRVGTIIGGNPPTPLNPPIMRGQGPAFYRPMKRVGQVDDPSRGAARFNPKKGGRRSK